MINCLQKAIQDSESEWSQNKKLIDLREKNVRRSVSYCLIIMLQRISYILIHEAYCVFLAHLAEGHESLCHSAASVLPQLFPLNDFFSRTTRPISTKFDRKHAWGDGDSDVFK